MSAGSAWSDTLDFVSIKAGDWVRCRNGQLGELVDYLRGTPVIRWPLTDAKVTLERLIADRRRYLDYVNKENAR